MERELTGGQVDLLGETVGFGEEIVVIDGEKGKLDGLGDMGDEFAVDVVNGDFEHERAVEASVGVLEEGDLAGWEAEVDLVADGFRSERFLRWSASGLGGGPDANVEENLSAGGGITLHGSFEEFGAGWGRVRSGNALGVVALTVEEVKVGQVYLHLDFVVVAIVLLVIWDVGERVEVGLVVDGFRDGGG